MQGKVSPASHILHLHYSAEITFCREWNDLTSIS